MEETAGVSSGLTFLAQLKHSVWKDQVTGLGGAHAGVCQRATSAGIISVLGLYLCLQHSSEERLSKLMIKPLQMDGLRCFIKCKGGLLDMINSTSFVIFFPFWLCMCSFRWLSPSYVHHYHFDCVVIQVRTGCICFHSKDWAPSSNCSDTLMLFWGVHTWEHTGDQALECTCVDKCNSVMTH